jgi:hypothetical protein
MPPVGPATISLFAVAPLIVWRVYVRFKRASGRQRLTRYRAPITLTIYLLLVAAVVLANLRRPANLAVLAGTLAAGACLAAVALRQTTFEATRKGLFYTPHGPIGLLLALLFVARLAYRLVDVYVLDNTAPRSAAEFGQSTLTVGAFGLLAGYYCWYVLGLARWRHRLIEAKRPRELIKGDA